MISLRISGMGGGGGAAGAAVFASSSCDDWSWNVLAGENRNPRVSSYRDENVNFPKNKIYLY
jgi:hypothetical protein